VTAYLVLGALAWAVATRGGTSLRELLIVLGLLVAAMIVSRAWPRRNPLLWVTFAALLFWVLAAGPLSAGWNLITVRVPLLIVIATVTVLVVGRLSVRDQQTLVRGVIAVGCLQAAIALVELAVTAAAEPAVIPRTVAMLGSPNSLGMLLVATGVLTARELARTGGRLLAAALLLQGAALLSTGSRTAILVASALVVLYVLSSGGWRVRAAAGAGLTAGLLLVVWRTAAEPQDRLELWEEAVGRIASRPLLGEGPPVEPFSPAIAGSRTTAHAHNELLQWGVEYGMLGVGLLLMVLVLALRTTGPLSGGDRFVQCAAIALLAAGVTDFTLRVTAITIAAAALATMGVAGGRPAEQPLANRLVRARAG